MGSSTIVIWRRDRCTEGHYFLGLLFTTATGLLHLIATFSTPYLDYDYLSTCSVLRGTERFGTLNPPNSSWRAVTKLIPTSAAISIVAFIVLVIHMTGKALDHHLFYRLTAAIAAFVGVGAAASNIAFWVIERNEAYGRLGGGIYIALLGGITAALSFFLSGPRYGGTVVYRARGAYTV